RCFRVRRRQTTRAAFGCKSLGITTRMGRPRRAHRGGAARKPRTGRKFHPDVIDGGLKVRHDRAVHTYEDATSRVILPEQREACDEGVLTSDDSDPHSCSVAVFFIEAPGVVACPG